MRALAALAEGQPAEAERWAERCLSLYRTRGEEGGFWPQMVRGHVSGALGRLEESRQAWGVALRGYLSLGYMYGCVWDALSGVALWFAHAGQVERAVELYALCLKDPFVAHSRWHEDVCGRPIAEAARSLPPEVVAAAEERGRQREWLATLNELIAEFAH